MSEITSLKLVELTTKQNTDNSIILLDVRQPNPFSEYHIKGSINIDVYNDLWQYNLDAVKQKLASLPKDKKIIAVCNVGATSKMASQVLSSMGYDAASLEGGMIAWNSVHYPFDIASDGDLVLKQMIRVGKGCLSYIIASKNTKECIVVDPSQFYWEYEKIIKDNGWKLKAVIETHAQADHISGAKQLADRHKAQHYISSKDMKVSGFTDIKDEDIIKLWDIIIKSISTPGHTDGCMCYLVNDKYLLTGDTFFLDGVGRPDLVNDRAAVELGARKLFDSLTRLKQLPNEVLVLPAHFTDYETLPVYNSLGKVKQNKSMTIENKKEFVEYIMSRLTKQPSNYEIINSLNKKMETIPLEIGTQMEFGPNRCASKG